MMEFVAFFPHPPIVINEVGGKESLKVAATAKAMEALAGEIERAAPDLLVTISPHGHVFSDAISITALNPLQGDLARFGAPEIKVEFSLDHQALEAVLEKCGGTIYCAALYAEDIKKYGLERGLDHGLVVPLSIIARKGWQGRLLPLNIGLLPYEELYNFGILLGQALDSLGKGWVLLISGDLSHRLLPGAPAGYSPRGAVFDEIIRQCVREGDVKRVFNLEPDLVEEAGECGLRPLVMGLGVLDGYEIEGEELSYEGPFGVGYLVARLKRGKKQADRKLGDDLFLERENKLKDSRSRESYLVRLARLSIGHYLSTGNFLKAPPEPSKEDRDLLAGKAGAFVSLKKFGQLRGCIGTIEPTRDDLGQEVIHNAVSAALHDPRFEPLKSEEMDQLNVSVDVLGQPEKISTLDELDTAVYGVIVSKGGRRGLLLPDLPGIDTPAEQVRIAREKAGIGPDEAVVLERFKVTRYT